MLAQHIHHAILHLEASVLVVTAVWEVALTYQHNHAMTAMADRTIMSMARQQTLLDLYLMAATGTLLQNIIAMVILRQAPMYNVRQATHALMAHVSVEDNSVYMMVCVVMDRNAWFGNVPATFALRIVSAHLVTYVQWIMSTILANVSLVER